MTSDREQFLAGERPTDVHIYLHEDSVSDLDALEAHGERVDDGIVLVMDGEKARGVFQTATGIDRSFGMNATRLVALVDTATARG